MGLQNLILFYDYRSTVKNQSRYKTNKQNHNQLLRLKRSL